MPYHSVMNVRPIFLILHGSLLDWLNSILFRGLRLTMLLRPLHPTVDCSPQFPSSHPHFPNTFPTSPIARFYRPPTRQSCVRKKGIETDLSIETELKQKTRWGDQYQFTCILFFHPTFPPSVFAGRRIVRSSAGLGDQLLPHLPC